MLSTCAYATAMNSLWQRTEILCVAGDLGTGTRGQIAAYHAVPLILALCEHTVNTAVCIV